MDDPVATQDPAHTTSGCDADPRLSSRVRARIREALALAQYAGDDRVPF
ncbi:hypothetical protein BH11ACT8_BH11ACT8_03820 [soil metagenome]